MQKLAQHENHSLFLENQFPVSEKQQLILKRWSDQQQADKWRPYSF